MNLPTTSNFEKIAVEEIPLIDVRAPIEYEKGAFINAINLPLMNDKERHLVGICYKEKGNEEAIKLGHELVSGKIKKERINSWIDYLEKCPDSIIYCFRGGLRSKITQQWITEVTGKEIERLEGGYKAFRNYLLTQLQPSYQKSTPILLSGSTGAGKTIMLKKLKNAIDLEGIANHRGSSFGNKITPQPTQINFENNLAYALIRHRNKGYKHIILEDEGRNVGRCFIPKPLAMYFNMGKIVLVNVPFEERVKITMDEYVYQAQKNYNEVYTVNKGLEEWANYIRTSINKIKKRLGGIRFNKVLDLFEQAYQEQIKTGNMTLHKNWLETLLKDYYDPMYKYQIQKKADRIVFEGSTNEVLHYLEYKCGI
ncbi:MAG: tRNA 2-selenouridine(34) synthase MnmH [Eubacteriales bacterium]